MKKYKGLLIGANLILVLLYINYSVQSKEKLLTNGKIVFFELAPVDPRSLMQGDYMLLRYKMLEDIQANNKRMKELEDNLLLRLSNSKVR